MQESNEYDIDNLLQAEGIASYKDIPKIRVIVRKRPLNKKELQRNDIDIIEKRGPKTCVVKELKNKVDLTKYIEEHHFNYDMVFDENSTNEMIYLETVRPMIDAAFNKAKITCFAYGQTGSGKTYTMMGANGGKDISAPGLYILCSYDIFSYLEQERYSHLEIWVSFYEIYCGKLFDLLNDRNVLQAREDGRQNICIVGLHEKPVTNLKAMMSIIEYGLKSRTTGVTGANMDSSRSHAVLQICIKEPNGSQHGKISFIDLAGSERAVDTIDTNRQTKMDGAEINKSLLALKECIRALDQEKRHTPFRGSKLTLVLRDSFMGNCKTMMIGNISPCLSCSEHTLNTLRYADRVKELRKDRSDREVQPKQGDPTDDLARMLMMPRQHSKTVKYTVDVKKMTQMEGKSKKGTTHISQLYQKSGAGGNNYRPQSSNFMGSSKQLTSKQGLSTNNLRGYAQERELKGPSIKDYVSKYKNMQIKSDEDFQKLSNEHENLINNILCEEEAFIASHKSHIDEMVDVIKQEMNLINQVDKPGSDIDQYVGSLDKALASQVDKINSVRSRLQKFNILLKDEEALSSKFSTSSIYQNEIVDAYDLQSKNFGENHINTEADNDEDVLNEHIKLK